MPWDRILDPADLEPAGEDAAAPASEATPREPGGGGADELDLADMDDWTPGFLRDEDMSERQMDDDELFAGLEEGDVSFDLEHVREDVSDEDVAEDTPSEGSGVVTETMAELYAEQGLFDDALRVYRQLLEERPADERLQARIREIQSRQARDASISAAEVDAVDTAEAAAETPAMQPGPATPRKFAEEGPERADVSPVSGLMSGGVSELIAENHDGDEGDFEFEVTASGADLASADPFAGSLDAGLAQGQPATSSAQPAPERPTPEPVAAESPPAEMELGAAIAEATMVSDYEPAETADRAMSTVPRGEGGEGVETIEDYLSRLLDYDPSAHSKPTAAPAQAGDAPPRGSDPDEEGGSADSDPEDMAQFQEWLRSLKR